MALRLSQLFGNSAEFWLNAQRAVDLWDAALELKRKGTHIKRLSVAYPVVERKAPREVDSGSDRA